MQPKLQCAYSANQGPIELGFLVFSAGLAESNDRDANTDPVIPVVDPVLTEFVRTTLDQNPEVLAAAAAVDTRSALERAASRPLYNPELEIDAETAEDDTLSIGINQTIDWSGKRKARTEVARFERDVAIAQLSAIRTDIAVFLLVALTDYQIADDRTSLAAQRIEMMQRFSEIAQRRFTAGDLTQVDLSVANLAAARARMQSATSDAQLATADQSIRELVSGVAPDNWPKLPDHIPLVPGTIDVQLLVANVPEVRAQRARVTSADAAVELRKRERRADPTIGIRGGEENSETLVGFTFSIPLNVRNRFSAEVAAAQSERHRAMRLAQNGELIARARIVFAAKRYELALAAWSDWLINGEPSLSRQTELLQRLWEAGEINTTDYLVQLTQTLDTQESALELRREVWLAWFE